MIKVGFSYPTIKVAKVIQTKGGFQTILLLQITLLIGPKEQSLDCKLLQLLKGKLKTMKLTKLIPVISAN